MKGFSGTNRSKLLSPFSIMTWILIALMMFSSLTSVIAETSEGNKATTMVFIIDSSTYVVNGEPIVMDVSPTIIEDRTMLPIRYAAEPLGADIQWDGVERKATISLGATKLELWIGQGNALINGKTVPIDADNANVKPLIVSDRTMLPLRFVTENLGCDIEWDPVDRKATITKAGSGKIPGMSMIDPGKISGIDIIGPGTITDIGKIGPGTIADIGVDPFADFDKITIRPDIRSDLKSDDISGLKDTWGKDPQGKEIPVNPTEADIPVIMRVGCGYDVFGEYASVDSLKQQVLDTQKLIQDQRMVRIRYDDVKEPSVEGRSIREYSNNMSAKVSAKGSYMGFGGSVSANFAQERIEKTDQYFATHSYLVRKYGVYIKAPTNFKNYLTADAKKMLNDNNVSAKTIFDTFGHYVLVDSITGGRADYSITASSKASTSYDNFSIAAKAEYKSLFASASVSTEYKNVTNKAAYDSNRREEFVAFGGISLNQGQFSDPNALAKWASSLEDTGTLVEFGNKTTTALVPIWELCDFFFRRDYLKKEFDKLNLANAEENKWPVQKYIKDIMLMYHPKDKDEARNETRAGWQLLNVDLNEGLGGHFIYLAYLESEDPEGAITDIFMESRGQGRSDEVKEKRNHNQNYVEYYTGMNLNQGVGGRFLYLWFTWEKTLPPITGLDFALDNPESVKPDWDSVCWQNTHTPANANEGTKGTPVYIKFRR